MEAEQRYKYRTTKRRQNKGKMDMRRSTYKTHKHNTGFLYNHGLYVHVASTVVVAARARASTRATARRTTTTTKTKKTRREGGSMCKR